MALFTNLLVTNYFWDYFCGRVYSWQKEKKNKSCPTPSPQELGEKPDILLYLLLACVCVKQPPLFSALSASANGLSLAAQFVFTDAREPRTSSETTRGQIGATHNVLRFFKGYSEKL